MPAAVTIDKQYILDRVQEVPWSGCWLWDATATAGRGQSRRGKIKNKGRVLVAPRVAYELWRGPIADGGMVLHACDVGLCCNPDHLYVGDHADNTRDAVERARFVRGRSHWNSKLSERDVRAMRERRASGAKLADIAAEFGVSRSNASLVCSGAAWGWVL